MDRIEKLVQLEARSLGALTIDPWIITAFRMIVPGGIAKATTILDELLQAPIMMSD